METIKVNMNPNPLDVQTIHASQNDGEARQWEFELHNNGELIDTSDITEQLFFKAYKGGTEQILPENTSTPTTSPFKGDIRYPQGLLTDQEFTYRQSPTEEDGLAKITDIKGNTIVWNQLVEKGNMTDGWTFSNSTGSYSNNILTFTASAQGGFVRPNNPQSIVANHKYLAMVDVKGTSAFISAINFTSRNLISANITTNWQTFSLLFTNTTTEQNYFPRIYDNRSSGWDAVQIRNCMLFDLSQMELDVTAEQFRSYFLLSYYPYNRGSLLNFNGTGIKTIGKNLFDYSTFAQGTINTSDGSESLSTTRLRSPFIMVFPGEYTLSSGNGYDVVFDVYNRSGTFIRSESTTTWSATPHTFTVHGERLVRVLFRKTDNSYIDVSELSEEQMEFGSTATSYEPYTSSTLSLPVSTYFPNGMDGVGTDYDELTNTKATTRMTRVDLGSLTWTKESRQNRFNSRALEDAKSFPSDSVANAICAKYITITADDTYFGNDGLSIDSGGRVNIYDSAYASATASDFKTAMSGVYLVYPLATPTETSFTTASLVTENAEIPLSNDDGVLIGKCTEELSAEPGFHDAKIKLSDSDGDVYSNKLQLHVERKPS